MRVISRSIGLPSKSVSFTPSQRQNGHVAVGEKVDIARVVQNAGNIGGNEVLALAHPDHNRGPRTRGDDLVWLG